MQVKLRDCHLSEAITSMFQLQRFCHRGHRKTGYFFPKAISQFHLLRAVFFTISSNRHAGQGILQVAIHTFGGLPDCRRWLRKIQLPCTLEKGVLTLQKHHCVLSLIPLAKLPNFGVFVGMRSMGQKPTMVTRACIARTI